MIVLDSSAVIHILRGTHQGDVLKQKLLGVPLGVCSLTVFEVLRGARPHEVKTTKEFLASMEQLDLNDIIARRAVDLEKVLQSQGRQLSTIDLFIAATCLSGMHSLATTDDDFTQVPGLTRVSA